MYVIVKRTAICNIKRSIIFINYYIFNQIREYKRWWTRDWLLRRPLYGQHEALIAEMFAEDPASYKKFNRIGPNMSSLAESLNSVNRFLDVLVL
jgi:hypothetical protein